MDSSPLLLILATTLSVPSGPAVDHSAIRKASEVRRLERTRAWLHEHWAQQMKVMADSQACADQARGWSDLGRCARIAQQRVRLEEVVPAATCAAGDEGGELTAASAPAEPQPTPPAPQTQAALVAGQH